MRAMIVCVSVSHGNTRKVADAFGEELGARVVEPEEVRPEEVPGHDLVGFGSGIYYMRPHRRLLDLVDRLHDGGGTEVFTFATSGSSGLPGLRYPRSLDKALERRGYEVVDIERARAFARSVAEAVAPRS